MTICRLLLASVAGLSIGLAQAQERPEPAPATADDSVETAAPADTRPPEKPAVEEPADDSTDTATDETASDETAAAEGEFFGPPPPPVWYVQRESDQEFAACKLALSLLGTSYREEAAIMDADNPECGIARPLRVERILHDLTLEGGALMRCDTARALGFWAQEFLRPASSMLPDAPRVTALQLGTTYDCRGRVGTDEDVPKLSEHAYGNAIDIAAFVFDNGKTMPVEPRQDSGDLTEAFQISVQKAGCLFFTTVLGPGSNAAHADHLHFDVAVRNGGWRLCQ